MLCGLSSDDKVSNNSGDSTFLLYSHTDTKKMLSNSLSFNALKSLNRKAADY